MVSSKFVTSSFLWLHVFVSYNDLAFSAVSVFRLSLGVFLSK